MVEKKRSKSAPASAGSRKHKIAAYYEVRYPEKKLRRMRHNGADIHMMRVWADNYKTPSGASGIHAFIKVGKAMNLNINQAA